jgi:hypothetical protein
MSHYGNVEIRANQDRIRVDYTRCLHFRKRYAAHQVKADQNRPENLLQQILRRWLKRREEAEVLAARRAPMVRSNLDAPA